MRRRDFITLLGGIAALPLAAHAQQPPTMPVIGYLNGASAAQFPQLLAGFHKGLSEIGYSKGRDVTFEYRYANGQHDRLPELAADLVSRIADLEQRLSDLETRVSDLEGTDTQRLCH